MVLSATLFFIVLIGTLLQKKGSAGEVEFPVAECIHGSGESAAWLDRIGVWTAVGVLLIAIAYFPVFMTHDYNFTSPGFKRW
jgi:hypothetical protein